MGGISFADGKDDCTVLSAVEMEPGVRGSKFWVAIYNFIYIFNIKLYRESKCNWWVEVVSKV